MTARVIDMAAWRAERERAAIRRMHAGPVVPKRLTLDQVMGFAPLPYGGGAA